jgi:cytochrome b involved in lipid metabolism
MKNESVSIESHSNFIDGAEQRQENREPAKPKITNLFASFISCLWKKDLIIFHDYSEVEKEAQKKGKVLIIYKDSVYDVTTFLDEHPGGKELLLLANGKIVDKVWDKYHYPLGKAPKLMRKFKIGEVHPSDQKS